MMYITLLGSVFTDVKDATMGFKQNGVTNHILTAEGTENNKKRVLELMNKYESDYSASANVKTFVFFVSKEEHYYIHLIY